MRARTLAEKVYARVSGKEDVTVGETIWLEPDLVSFYEWPSTSDREMQLATEGAGGQCKLTDKTVVFIDHMVPAVGESDAEFHKDTFRWCKEQGVKCIGNMGIGHQVMSEMGLAKPGELIINHDTHVQPLGAIGALAITTGQDMHLPLAIGKTWLEVPATIQVELTGHFQKGVGGRDLIHKLVRDYSTEFGIGAVIEFVGEGARDMAIDERMNMLAQVFLTGAYCGIFPFDDTAAAWMKEHGLEIPENVPETDPDADIQERITINLDELTPLVALPGDPADIGNLEDVIGTPIDQGFIGSCAGGRLEDIRLAAKILEGKRISDEMKFYVVPTSNYIMSEAMRLGYLKTLVDAGAFISSPTCDYCYGKIQTLSAGEVMVGTNTLNIVGRVGSIHSKVYLTNAAVVAASVLEGKIADPRKYL